MNKESEHALQLLTGKPNISEVSLAELQQIADAHPYFAAAQFLLAQKMKQEQSGDLREQLQKTALYFPNELWLCYLLTENKKENIQPAITVDEEAVTAPVIEKTETGSLTKQAAVEPVIDQTDEVSHGFLRIANSKKTSDDELLKKNTYEPVAEQEENQPNEASQSSKETEDSNLITLPAEQVLEDIWDTGNITHEPEEASLDEEELREQAEDLPAAQTTLKISSLLSMQAEEFHMPVAENTELPIAAPEPLHTIDYFASQGILLDPNRKENTFDKKVHKFTDWLRQMKRINPQPADLGTETEEEQYVASIADSSNHTKKVLTESMAEVLLKQGKRDKAIEIYQKLSLLNPDKSVYFAALIQNIK